MRPLYWALTAGAAFLGWRAYQGAKAAAAQITKTTAQKSADLGRMDAYTQRVIGRGVYDQASLGAYSPAALEARAAIENDRLDTSFRGGNLWEPGGEWHPQFESALQASRNRGLQVGHLINTQLRAAARYGR